MNRTHGQFYMLLPPTKLGSKTPRTVSVQKREKGLHALRDSSRGDNMEYKIPLISLEEQVKMMPKFMNSQRNIYSKQAFKYDESDSPIRIRESAKSKLTTLRKISDQPKLGNQSSMDNIDNKYTNIPNKIKQLLPIYRNLISLETKPNTIESVLIANKSLFDLMQTGNNEIDEGFSHMVCEYLHKSIIQAFSSLEPNTQHSINITKWILKMVAKVKSKVSIANIDKLQLIQSIFYIAIKQLECHATVEAFALTWKIMAVYIDAINYSKHTSIGKLNKIEAEFHKRIALVEGCNASSSNIDICYEGQSEENAKERLKSSVVIFKMQIADLKKSLTEKEEELKLVITLKNDLHQKLNETVHLNTLLKKALKMPTMKNKEQMSNKAYESISNTIYPVLDNCTQTIEAVNILDMLNPKDAPKPKTFKDRDIQVSMPDSPSLLKVQYDTKPKSPSADVLSLLNRSKDQNDDKKREMLAQYQETQRKIQNLYSNCKEVQTEPYNPLPPPSPSLKKESKLEIPSIAQEKKLEVKEIKETVNTKPLRAESPVVMTKIKKAKKSKRSLCKIEILDNFNYIPKIKDISQPAIEIPKKDIQIKELVVIQKEQREVQRLYCSTVLAYISMKNNTETNSNNSNGNKSPEPVTQPPIVEREFNKTPNEKKLPIIKHLQPKQIPKKKTNEGLIIPIANIENKESESPKDSPKVSPKASKKASNKYSNQATPRVKSIPPFFIGREELPSNCSVKEEILYHLQSIEEYANEMAEREPNAADILSNAQLIRNSLLRMPVPEKRLKSKNNDSTPSSRLKSEEQDNQIASMDHRLINSIMSTYINRKPT